MTNGERTEIESYCGATEGDYQSFIESKAHSGDDVGFSATFLPESLYDFQKTLVQWALQKGRAAIFADCGLGKTLMQLVFAQNCIERTNKPALIIAPLAVTYQTVMEGKKFGIDVVHLGRGEVPSVGISIINYDRIHQVDFQDIHCVILDESSILKNYAGKIRQKITESISHIAYRLLCTATPSPNDYMELGNSAEALGVLRRQEMLGMYFTHDASNTSQWQLKGHGKKAFWGWLSTWARMIRWPSDLGYNNDKFQLPPLEYQQHVLSGIARDGELFVVPAIGLHEQRQESRASLSVRCEKVAQLATVDDSPFVAWCSLNDEGAMLKRLIPDAEEVRGADKEEVKAEKLIAFSNGELRCLITKPSIAGFGLNWQHCYRLSFFPSHSFEQYYQALRRCWRFGQRHSVTAHIVTTDANLLVLQNLLRKEEKAKEMQKDMSIAVREYQTKTPESCVPQITMEIPEWLK